MKFNFRKIGSVLASGAMLSSTVALAAAANFPAPFVSGGASDVAIVHGGADAAYTDLVAVTDISSKLASELAKQTATGGAKGTSSVSGEAYELFTSGTPLLLNSTINAVRGSISASQLPTVLKDGIFETTTNIDYTQRINLGSTPKLEFKQQPSSSDDPQFGFSLSTTASTGYIYNATVTFDENVNFTHADSTGETIDLFGSRFTVGGATSGSKLILLKSAQEASLTNTDPSAEVTVDGKAYTIELVTASDSDARIKVTDSGGNSDSKVIAEAGSKTIQGLEVAVDSADENNFQLSATILVGSSRITFQDGAAVKIGTDEKAVEGTQVEFELTNGTGGSPAEAGKIIVQVTADSSDKDAIFPGGAFVDPIFGSFKVDFSGISVPFDSTAREDIEIKNSGNDKMTVKFRSHDGSEPVTAYWAYNKTDSDASRMDLADNDGDKIVVAEKDLVNKSEYVVLSSDDEGGLYEVTAIYNSSTGFSDDYVELKNILTGNTKSYKATSEGTITGLTEQGKTYTVTYTGSASSAQETRQVRVNFDESSGDKMILFPTIATSKGAKVAFYEPTTINLNSWDGSSPLDDLMFQDGDGYTTVTATHSHTLPTSVESYWNFTFGTTTTSLNTSTTDSSASGSIGKVTYNISTTGTSNQTTVRLVSPQGGNIVRPALIIFEEKDDATNYEAMVVTLDGGYDGDSAGVGVTDVVRTWSADSVNDEIQLETNSDLYQEMDLWGSLITLDKSDSDQTTAKIGYPDEQVIANVYIAEESAAITTTGGTGVGTVKELGGVSVADSEVGSVSGKNLIVVGGTCVNSVAADLLGVSSPTCGAGFTTKTGIGSGEYLIETFSRSGGKVATLVAGYNAGDTTNAAKAFTTQTVDTTVGKKYKGTSSTAIEAVMAEGA